MAKHKTTISLSDEVYEHLRELSFKSHQSFSKIITDKLEAPYVASAPTTIPYVSNSFKKEQTFKDLKSTFSPAPKPKK